MTTTRPGLTSKLGSLVLMAMWLSACPSDDSAEGNASETSTETQDPTTDGDSGTETGDEGDPNLVEVPGATFMMGCGVGDTDCDSDNAAHDVTVSSFYIERTEVSVMAYRACVDDGSCTAPGGMDPDCNYGVSGRDAHPVNCVNWQQAVDYCSWLGRRLPTEAEWELAAAGPDSRPFPWGTGEANCMLAHMAQMSGDMGDYGCLTGITSPVEAYDNGASVDGVLQLSGNVDEWCSDWYGVDYYQSGENTDPSGPADGTQRVNRGGDMYDASPNNLRVFERRKSNPDQAPPERGFRCAADMP